MSNNLKIALLQKNLLKSKEKIPIENSIKFKKPNKKISAELSKEINKLANPKKGQIYVHINNGNYSFYQFNGNEWQDII